MLRLLACVALLALVPASTAAAAGYVEIVAPGGRIVAQARDGGAFAYPRDGSLVRVGAVEVGRDGLQLDRVSLLGGRLTASSLALPPQRGAIVLSGVAADGRPVSAELNELVPLGDAGYAIVAQIAATARVSGRVGIRLVLQRPRLGLPAGTQVLVGLPFAPAQRATAATVSAPLAVLGFTGGALQLAALAPPLAFLGTTGEKAAELARQYLGVPYVWGGADPAVGLDCSGLTMLVYAQLGIQLTHYTGAQWHEGTRIPRDELQPGDLVFFDGASDPQHVGIYIGDDEFIQAPHTGDIVKISSLGDPNYGLRYVGAVRPYAP